MHIHLISALSISLLVSCFSGSNMQAMEKKPLVSLISQPNMIIYSVCVQGKNTAAVRLNHQTGRSELSADSYVALEVQNGKFTFRKDGQTLYNELRSNYESQQKYKAKL